MPAAGGGKCGEVLLPVIAPGGNAGTLRAMKGVLSFLNLNFLPKSPDFGLLLLRAALGLGMLRHGWEKWEKWDQYKTTFFDPLHIGHKWSLILALFAEVICSGLLVIGFCSRFAALLLTVMMSVTFFIAQKGDLKAGELTAVYLAGYVAILMAGPGKFSFDGNGGGGDGGAH